MPGQPCAFWRWARRGQKKRGTWVIARFLSWDPSHPGKQAWVKTGATSILVTAEQLRAAFGFEQWTPEEADIRALRDASQKFSDHLLRDEQGPPPPDNLMVDDDTIDTNANLDINAELNEPLALTVPSLPQQSQAIQPMSPQPQLEIPHIQPTTMQQTSIQAHHQQQQQQQHTTINLHTSPERVTNQLIQQQQFHRYGHVPGTPVSRRRSRTPTSRRLTQAPQQTPTTAVSPQEATLDFPPDAQPSQRHALADPYQELPAQPGSTEHQHTPAL